MNAESAKRICCVLAAGVAVVLVGCKVELPKPPAPPNTAPFKYWSEIRGRIEFREFKKWAEDESRTRDALRERVGGPDGTTNAAAPGETWIYKDKFYDKEPKLLIRVFEIPFDTNGAVQKPLPAYKP
ncbi:MAG: hypothetical protein EBU46_10175 [Nitrosomonadaceae bacterium]|nr:hypothetical protein [Nitrosomonadaceae bacterium]